MEKDEIKKNIRKGYAQIATQSNSCCGPAKSCCDPSNLAKDISKGIGYSEEEISAVPEGSNLGLGCGNPTAIAVLNEGDTYLDLGSGAGFDCFLAANKVGENGKVIGVDMTPKMVEKARANAKKGGYENVEFRLGEIENLPVKDNTVDVITSNCVINLSIDKKKVFEEAIRVLKPGGTIAVSDIVLLHELPISMRNSVEAYIGCLTGAMLRDEYLRIIKQAGFKDLRIINETVFQIEHMLNDPTAKALVQNLNLSKEKMEELSKSVVRIKFTAKKEVKKWKEKL